MTLAPTSRQRIAAAIQVLAVAALAMLFLWPPLAQAQDKRDAATPYFRKLDSMEARMQACVTCHGHDDQRIRLQDLPNLTKLDGAQKAYTTWPAYRVSQGELRTFQWRLNDCFRQQRFPELEFGSDASIALTLFLARNANGAAFDAPAIKR